MLQGHSQYHDNKDIVNRNKNKNILLTMITANNKDTKAINTLFVFLLLLLNPINSLIYCFYS